MCTVNKVVDCNSLYFEKLTDANPDIREEELDVSDEVPEIKSKLSFKEENEEVVNRGQQHNRHQRVTEAQVNETFNPTGPKYKYIIQTNDDPLCKGSRLFHKFVLSAMMATDKLFITETCKVVTLMSNVCSGGKERTSKERAAQQTSGNKTGQHRQSQTQIKTQV